MVIFLRIYNSSISLKKAATHPLTTLVVAKRNCVLFSTAPTTSPNPVRDASGLLVFVRR
jgi:hypothetical protein